MIESWYEVEFHYETQSPIEGGHFPSIESAETFAFRKHKRNWESVTIFKYEKCPVITEYRRKSNHRIQEEKKEIGILRELRNSVKKNWRS